MIFPGDLPDIPPKVIDALIVRFNECGRGIVVAVHRGKRGHPLLISRKYFKAVAELDSDKGLKELMSRFKPDVEEVEANDIMVLRDIDTREEYIKAINKSK
jgi:molybdenum cofactor cytidylyltransferase